MTASDTSTDSVRDSLFSQPLGDIAGFRFDQSVVDVFPDMLKRSIPGYQSIIAQTGLLAARFVQPDSRLYDLGSSLGATALSMRNAVEAVEDADRCAVHGVDNSQAMIERCRDVIAMDDARREPTDPGRIPIVLHCDDVRSHAIDNASVVAMNFTLQFVAPETRDDLIDRISRALRPGGALILSEKVCFDDPTLDALHIDMYHAFKSANGYSDLEISQKRTALENVLVPDTLTTHQARLTKHGFRSSSVWFQCFNFASLVAIKAP